MTTFAKYTQIVHQLEEAKRFISFGSSPYLRMALILLDNAIELLLTMAIQPEFERDELESMLIDLRKRIKEAGGSLPPRDGEEYEPLTEREKSRISWSFPEKVRFLTSEDRSVIDRSIGDVIIHLHNYRNSAYHEGFIRRETILPAVMLQFEIATSLATEFGPVSASSADPDDWLQERYGFSSWDIHERANRETIVAELRSGMPLGQQDVMDHLGAHVESRVDQAYEALDFIRDAFDAPSREYALKLVQYAREYPGDPIFPDPSNFHSYEAKSKLADFEGMREKAQQIRSASSQIDAFRIFAQVEAALEPLEEIVFEMAAEIEHQIELQVDAMRGK